MADYVTVFVNHFRGERILECYGVREANHHIIQKSQDVIMASTVLIELHANDFLSSCDTFGTFLESERTDNDATFRTGVYDAVRQAANFLLILLRSRVPTALHDYEPGVALSEPFGIDLPTCAGSLPDHLLLSFDQPQIEFIGEPVDQVAYVSNRPVNSTYWFSRLGHGSMPGYRGRIREKG